MRSDKPFRYLTSEEFLALSEPRRAAYLQAVTDHLSVRAALPTNPQPPEKKKS